MELLWTLFGLAGVVAVGLLLVRLQPAALGPHSTRLLALTVALAAYFGVFSFTRHVPALARLCFTL